MKHINIEQFSNGELAFEFELADDMKEIDLTIIA